MALLFEKLTLSEELQLSQFLGERGWPFWHRLGDVWMVSVEDVYTPTSLRDALRELLSEKRFFAIEIEDMSAEASPEWLPWFVKHWDMTAENEGNQDAA